MVLYGARREMWGFVFPGLCGVIGLEGLANRAEVAEAGPGVGHGNLTRAVAAGDDPGAMGSQPPAGELRQAAEVERVPVLQQPRASGPISRLPFRSGGTFISTAFGCIIDPLLAGGAEQAPVRFDLRRNRQEPSSPRRHEQDWHVGAAGQARITAYEAVSLESSGSSGYDGGLRFDNWEMSA